MLIAAVRKLEALAMLISEMSVKRSAAAENTDVMRSVVRTTVFVAGCGVMLLFLLMLSSAILPSWKVLVGMGLLVVITIILLRKAFIRLYSVAQFALRETLTQPPPNLRVPTPTILPSLMAEASLKLITVDDESPFIGKSIGEMQLRTSTGASVVGIERTDENIINPGPDEELRSGDRLLLLGNATQLEKALNLFAETA
jgi:CPA2 family monovalent cation:H+ antiporter-2